MEKDPYKRFNKSVKQLYKTILNVYPDEPIIKLAQSAFLFFKSLDKTGPMTYFNSRIQDFKEDITCKNLDFLNKKDLCIPFFESASIRVKELFNVLNESDKQAFLDHLNILIYLGESEIRP